MPVKYTNRKGVVYYLQKGITKKGKPRYSFSREPSERCVEEIPDGYEITESVNGVVSLRKATPQLVSDLEVQNGCATGVALKDGFRCTAGGISRPWQNSMFVIWARSRFMNSFEMR